MGLGRPLGGALVAAGVAVGAFSAVALAGQFGNAVTSSENREVAPTTSSPTPTSVADPTTVEITSAAPSTTTSAVPPSETPEEFLGELAGAFVTNDQRFRFERLHPAVIERFGEQTCRAFIAGGKPDPTAAFAVLSVSEPQDYAWTTDGFTTVVPETLTVSVQYTAAGEQTEIEVHITELDGSFVYFADCGTPAP